MKLIINFLFYSIAFMLICFAISCQNRKLNYIDYYNRLYEIDSSYNVMNDQKLAVKDYSRLFRKFPPVNRREYEAYIKLADENKIDFGKKGALYKLIPLIAPDWKRNKLDTAMIKIYNKYEIDSLEITQKINDWKKGLNRQLIDSFSIAFERKEKTFWSQNTQEAIKKHKITDKQNEELLIWTLNNFGFPSLQKIGLWGNDNIWMPIGLLMYHNSCMPERINLYSEKLLEYVKSGELSPEDYAAFIDNYRYNNKLGTKYGQISHISERDSMIINLKKINKIRKSIGLKQYDRKEFEVNSKY